jgi:acetolactate synthase-1/2/3 large subunit
VNQKEGNQEPFNVADLLVQCLEEEGVKYVFGIPGEEILAVMDALHRSKIRFILTRHEQGAAFMADVYGRLTGKAGVCLATLGPGATNLITGVADAFSDGAPLVAITGQVGTDKMHITAHQYLNLTQIFEPVTKRTKLIVGPQTVSEIVRLAFKYAESERPGATHIDLPVDVSKMPVGPTDRPLKKSRGTKELASYDCIEKAAAEIFKSRNPVILVGSVALRDNASAAVTKFAESLKIPVVNTMMAKGVIPSDSQYAMMTIGIPQKDYADRIVEYADLVITIGYDIVEFSPSAWNPQKNKKILHINNRPPHINKFYQCGTEVVGDIAYSLEGIMMRTERQTEPEQAIRIKEKFLAEQSRYEDDMSFPLKPQKIISDIRCFMDRDDIVICDVGAHKMWMARLYGCCEPNTCIISNGFATMGIAVPGAIAAKLVHPEKKILAVTGDGGFMMNVQELEVAVREGLRFVVLIFRDDSYGLIKWKQFDQYGTNCHVDFTNPDFVRLAESMGCRGYRVESAGELPDVLAEAFSQQVPAVVDCPVDYGENAKLTQTLKKIYNEL